MRTPPASTDKKAPVISSGGGVGISSYHDREAWKDAILVDREGRCICLSREPSTGPSKSLLFG